MHKKLAVSSILALLSIFVLAAQASATDVSGTDQYQENIPGAGGDHPANHGGGGSSNGGGSSHNGGGGAGGSGGGGGGPTLPQASAAQLDAAGADGLAAASLAEDNAPATGGSAGNSGAGGSGHHGSANGGSANGGSANSGDQASTGSGQRGGVSGILHTLVGTSAEGEGGMGLALPIIIFGSLFAALVYLIARRRGFGPDRA